MKKSLSSLICLAVLPLLVSCSEESQHENQPKCDASHVNVCNAKNTALITCQNGKLVEVPCLSGCNAQTNTCLQQAPSQTQCVESSKACNADLSGYTVCTNGVPMPFSCAPGQKCDPVDQTCKSQLADENTQCTDEKNPASCNGATLSFCKDGVIRTVTCGAGTVCDTASKSCIRSQENVPGDKPDTPDPGDKPVTPDPGDKPDTPDPGDKPDTPENPDTPTPAVCTDGQTRCATPHTLQRCNGGKWISEKCSAGAVCNDAIAEKSCKTPKAGDACDPDTFSEICYGDTVALSCDEETLKVVRVDCAKEYGDKYKCDIAENFYGKDIDAVMCFSKEENCNETGDTKTECTFEDLEDGYRQFYTITYTCEKFNLGNHFYVSGEVDCEKSCNSSKTACSE